MSIVALVGGSQAIASTSGGKVYAYNQISTNSATVVPANPSRTKLTFHNPGDVDILVGPTILYNGGPLVSSPSARGGMFLVFANGGTTVVEGECQGSWQAFSVSGSGKPLTVMDSNI